MLEKAKVGISTIGNKGFGRLVSFDIRDMQYPIEAILPKKASPEKERYWNTEGWWGDQGYTSQCVGYAWAHWLEDGPVTQNLGPAPIINPAMIYAQAQKRDEWPGENYDGTSVRAAADWLKQCGLISEYRWGFTLDALIEAVLQKGPVVVGTNWYEGMMDPGKSGLVKVTGEAIGGHAYKIDGLSKPKKLFRFKQSWGRAWGKNGHGYISFDDMERLISEYGEVCLATEVKAVGKLNLVV